MGYWCRMLIDVRRHDGKDGCGEKVMRKIRVKLRSRVLGSKERVQNYEVKSGWFSRFSNQTTD